MARLAGALLPSPLVELIMREEDPVIQIFVGVSATVARIPWSFLPLPNGVRLGDAALVTLVPSATMCHEIRTRPRRGPPRVTRNVELLVIDPTDDLEWARSLQTRIPARVSLQGAAATRPAVLSALPDVAGEPGVAVFACHGDPGVGGAPATAGLILSRDDAREESAIRARDFLIENRRCIWDRVLVSSCSSAGVSEAQAEWLGLAAGMMWAGAEVVIAAAWDLPDERQTAAFDADLAELLAGHDDIAARLQRIQMEELRQWQEYGVQGGVPPLIAAAYQAASPYLPP